MADYVLYHGERFIDIGSMKNLAKRQNIKYKSIQYYHTLTYRKRTKDGYRLVKLED